MSAQEQGITAITELVRQLAPPSIEVLLVFYPRTDPLKISSAIAVRATGTAAHEQLAAWQRSKKAAAEYILRLPNNPSFAPQS